MPVTAAIRRDFNKMEDAAQLCRLLAAVQRARLVGDEQALDTLLSPITPSECSGVADELDEIAELEREVHVAQLRSLMHEVPRPLPPITERAGAEDPLVDGPLAPVVHLDPWNRRV